MNLSARPLSRLLLLAACAWPLAAVSCNDASNSVQAQDNTKAAATSEGESSEPVPERVLERSKERWDLIVKAGEDSTRWVEIYEYLTPTVRKQYPLTSYLPTKEQFAYDQPTEPKILKLAGDKAYLSVRATWLAYKHAQVRQADGGKDLVKPFQSIEEWHWIDGDWYLQQPHRESDFHRENPDFFKRDTSEEAK